MGAAALAPLIIGSIAATAGSLAIGQLTKPKIGGSDLDPGPDPGGVPDPATDEIVLRERLRRGRQSLRIDTTPPGTGLQIGGE